MMRPVLRAAIVGIAAILAYGTAEAVHFRLLCAKHLAWKRVQRDPTAMVLDSGVAIARNGDAIFVCATDHCFGPAGCHIDLGCYCAPSTTTESDLARFLNARSCAIDRPSPSPLDAGGACRYGRCDDHIGR